MYIIVAIVVAVVAYIIIKNNLSSAPDKAQNTTAKPEDVLTPEGIPKKDTPKPCSPARPDIKNSDDDSPHNNENTVFYQTATIKQKPAGRPDAPEETVVIDLDDDQQKAFDYAINGEKRLLILGAAGTGKSTLIKAITHKLESYGKEVMLLAPTGVAAINIGGATIHAQLELPISVAPAEKLGYRSGLETTLRNADTIIIDELSMVRADIMEAVMLRVETYNPKIQLIMVGDLMQLPPVLTSKDVTLYEDKGYDASFPYFVDALQDKAFMIVILDTFHRQKAGAYLNSLNKIRNGVEIQTAINQFNMNCKHYTLESTPAISLTATNAMASAINKEELKKLTGELHSYKAVVAPEDGYEKIHDYKDFPADKKLDLKEGAHVMITKNIYPDPENKKFIIPNGAIGRVKKLATSSIEVELLTSHPGYSLQICKFTWESYHYEYDKEEGQLIKIIDVYFTQFPLRLAWAITIHKSQGLTLENYAVNLGNNQFADNLAYVALSRGHSFADITLMNSLTIDDIRLNQRMLSLLSKLKTGVNTTFKKDTSIYPAKPNEEILESEQIIRQAMTCNQDIEFDYIDNTGKRSHRTVTPQEYPVKTRDGHKALKAHCHLRNEQRSFIVSKMTNLTTIDRASYIEDDYEHYLEDKEDYYEDSSFLGR